MASEEPVEIPAAEPETVNDEPLQPTAPPMPPPAQLPTMFGEVLENNVTFCVDTSGSMYNCLHIVKEHLIETLNKHANRNRDTLFNIVEFNTEVTQWADKMVKCTPETVAVAAEWINNLSAKTGTNTQDALLTAMSDRQCRAVYLVTDGQPDQSSEDILDHVAYVCENRPVHCVYLSEGKADEAATEFLEDLAVETFGSFHVVALTTHGCVERITPVYRSDHGPERLIRTVEDHIRPKVKTCSVSTTLAVDPEESLGFQRVAALNHFAHFPHYYPFMGPMPYRYYWPSYWSRYRPAKAWLKAQDSLNDPLVFSPSAGALLIGKRVMARRVDDGYFYMGTVQSQVLQDKFLVSFGPCKHGKYKDTSYQDTYVHDIIDLVDARRHTILTGDRVLAPWEPEGERYGPGIIIDGHEKRGAAGPDDRQITVTFSNGKTETVPANTAVWIPEPVYERLALELKMPRDARETLQQQDNYPLGSLPGYPVSGPASRPVDYSRGEAVVMDSDTVLMDAGLYNYPPYIPMNPMMARPQRQKAKVAVKSEDVNALIPGTNMTQKELQEKVQTLIDENSVEVEDRENAKEKRSEKKKLLKKRDKQTENSFRKSVSFNDENLVREAYINNNDVRVEDFDLGDADSGYATSPDLNEERERIEQERRLLEKERRFREWEKASLEDRLEQERRARDRPTRDEQWEKLQLERRSLERERRLLEKERQEYEWGLEEERSLGMDIDPRLLQRKVKPVGRRPPWRYWKQDPNSKKVKPKPFRETALQAPLEARDQRNAVINSVEWRSPVFKYVDPFARGDYSNSVELLMKPRPPTSGSEVSTTQQDGLGVASSLGYRIVNELNQEAARREFRRQQIVKRRDAWQQRLTEESSMKQAMQDQHHQQILSQLSRDRDRQVQEQNLIAQQREAKKKISVELRQRIEKNQQEEATREEQRIGALRMRRERREAIQSQRQQEMEAVTVRRQQIKVQRSQARADAYSAQLNEEESKNVAQWKQSHTAKVNRVKHYHQLEEQAQRDKDLRIAISNMQQSMRMSQIFP